MQGAPPAAPPAAPKTSSANGMPSTGLPHGLEGGPIGPSPDEERARRERVEEEKRLKEEIEEEEKARAEEAKKEAEEEVRKIQERIKQIDSEIRAAYKAIAASLVMAFVNPEAAEGAVAAKNKIKALKSEKSSLKSRLSGAKALVKKFGGRALGAMAGLGGLAKGPVVMFVIGIFAWMLLRAYGFGSLANWVLFSVVAALLIGIIFKEPKKGFIVFLLPIIIFLLDKMNMLTPANSSVAVAFVVAVMLLTFDVARDFIGRCLVVGSFLGGGIIIFWMSAWAQMQLGNAYPHIVTTIMMFGYFMWMLTKKGGIKWVALIINLLFFTMLLVMPGPIAPQGSPLRDAVDAQMTAWSNMFGKFGLFGQQAYKAVKTNYLMGIGDYEEGVQAESKKPLGVFLDNVGVTSKFVSPDGQIDMYARLRAESFKTEEQLNIMVKCYEESNEDKEHGTIRPKATFSAVEYESQDIDCIIPAASLGIGPKRIILDTSFTFITSSFLKVYFMEQDRIRAYKRQHSEENSNPLDQFGITDKNPVAIFTGGPLKVGMGVAQQPISLIRPGSGETGDEFGPTLGITLDKNWLEGELLEVSKIKISAPPGMVIRDVDAEACSTKSTNAAGEYECTLEGAILNKFFIDKPVKTPKTLRVHTGMDNIEQGIDSILAGAPMSIRSFKVEVSYTYRIKKEASVTVKQEAKK